MALIDITTVLSQDLTSRESARRLMRSIPAEDESQNVPQNVVDTVVDELTDRQRDILKILSLPIADDVVDKNAENASTLAKKLSVTTRTIQRDLAKLQKKGKIVYVGPDNGGHWEVI